MKLEDVKIGQKVELLKDAYGGDLKRRIYHKGSSGIVVHIQLDIVLVQVYNGVLYMRAEDLRLL
jgi:hypothetical protein